MNKKYMDFVPARAEKTVPSRKKAVPVQKEVGVTHRVTRTNKVISERVNFDERTMQAAKLGVIEDLSPKFINTNAEKRAVGKSEKVVKTEVKNSVEKPVEKVEEKKEVPKKSPFINQDKVVKRPLSKSTFRKEVPVPQEVPKGPVTIITKPEKDAHVSMVVTIILTIILGAAAGTVAFLLLPK